MTSEPAEAASGESLAKLTATVQTFKGRAAIVFQGVAEEAAAVHEGVVESVKSAYGQISATIQSPATQQLNPLNSCLRRQKTPESIADEKAKEEAELLKEEGNGLYKEGRFDDALFHYEKAIALDPRNARYRCNRAACLTSMGRMQQAAADLMRAASFAEPGYYRPRERIGVMCTREAGMTILLEACQSACKREPDCDELSQIMQMLVAVVYARNEGDQLFKRGNYADAERVYTEGLEKVALINGTADVAPIGAILLHCNRGAARAAVRRFREALADLDQALLYDPKHEQASERRDKIVMALNRAEMFGQGEARYGLSADSLKTAVRLGADGYAATQYAVGIL